MKTWMISFRLSQAYGVNSLIYRLRCLPVIKHIIPADLYANKGLKKFALVLVMIGKVLGAFGGKFLYLWLMAGLPANFLEGNRAENYTSILFFLTLGGCLINEDLFAATKQKYYAVILMRMDAKQYALENYRWFLGKLFVTFLPASFVIGSQFGLSVIQCTLIALFVPSVKPVGTWLLIKYYEKKERVCKIGSTYLLATAIPTFLLAYGMIFLKMIVPVEIYWIGVTVALSLSALCMSYLWKWDHYKQLYRQTLTMNAIIFNEKDTMVKNQQKAYLKKLSYEEVNAGDKKGFTYFNAVFISRHKRILTSSAKKMAAVLLVIFGAAFVFTSLKQDTSDGTNHLILTFLPYFVFIMYMINRGSVVTQAMFMNCDHSMLAYRFYRQPDAILSLFKIRLKTIIQINLIPAMVIACGLPLLLFTTGGTTQPLNYLLLFTSIIAMSVFFSVHHLTLYYLLQPYNINMEAKSSMYMIANAVTYGLCYIFIKYRAPTVIFASCVILFTVLYVGIALVLVYRLAPVRFRLK